MFQLSDKGSQRVVELSFELSIVEMFRRIALRISAQSLVGFARQQFLNRIRTVEMRQQLGRDQAVGQRIVDLMREVDLDIGELPVLFDGDRRRQATPQTPS